MPKPAANPLEAHLGYWLRFVSNHVSHAFRRKLEGRDVTVAEWVVLRELFERDDRAPSEIADRLGMTRGAISKLVDRLAAKALVTRTVGTDDRRYQTLALSPAGHDLMPALARLADENDAAFFGCLDSSERAVLERLLRDLARHHGLKSVPIE